MFTLAGLVKLKYVVLKESNIHFFVYAIITINKILYRYNYLRMVKLFVPQLDKHMETWWHY